MPNRRGMAWAVFGMAGNLVVSVFEEDHGEHANSDEPEQAEAF